MVSAGVLGGGLQHDTPVDASGQDQRRSEVDGDGELEMRIGRDVERDRVESQAVVLDRRAVVGRPSSEIAGSVSETGGARRVETGTRQAGMPSDLGQASISLVGPVERTGDPGVEPHPPAGAEIGVAPGPEHVVGEGEPPCGTIGTDDPCGLDPLEGVEDVVGATIERGSQQRRVDGVADDGSRVDDIDVADCEVLEAIGDDLAQ